MRTGKEETLGGHPTRRAILNAAKQLCCDHGMDGVKLREIARNVGISPATVFSHFDGLDDVLFTVVKDAVEALRSIPDGIEGLSTESAIYQMNLLTVQFLSQNKAATLLIVNDFSAAKRLPAFAANSEFIESWLMAEAAMLKRVCSFKPGKESKIRDLIVAKFGLVGNLLAVRWCNGDSMSKEDQVRIAQLASTLTTSVLTPRKSNTE